MVPWWRCRSATGLLQRGDAPLEALHVQALGLALHLGDTPTLVVGPALDVGDPPQSVRPPAPATA